MSDDEERVTKPFKFVTGMYPSANGYSNTHMDKRMLTPVTIAGTSPFYNPLHMANSHHPIDKTTHHLSIRPRHLPRHRAIILTRPIVTGFDARFPNQNQTKHCWQNYVDYHKCILAKGEDFAPCRQVRATRA
jgi:hypothetical protein